MLAVRKKKKKHNTTYLQTESQSTKYPLHSKINIWKHLSSSIAMQTFSSFPASCPLQLSPHLVAQSGKHRQVQMAPASSYNLSHHITAHESSIDHSEIKDPCLIQSQTPLIPNFASITSLISYRHSQHAALYVGIVVITHRHKCYFLLCLGFFVLFVLPPHCSWCPCHLSRAGLN